MERVWPWLERAAMRRVGRRIAAASRDRTAALSTGSCLILAPHPDDETLGCGGLAMRKRRAGARVDIIVVTDGAATHPDDPTRTLTRDAVIALREQETRAACDHLDVPSDKVGFLRFPDGDLAAHEDALRNRLAEQIAALRPDEIYVCALADGHRDHKALARVLRELGAAERLGEAVLYEYPVWFWDFRSWRPAGRSNKAGFVAGLRAARRHARGLRPVHVSIAGLQARKRAALACHRSQLGQLEDEPDWVGLPEHFLAFFLGDREIFFEVDPKGNDGTAP